MSAFPQALQPQLASLAAGLQSDPNPDPATGVLQEAQEAAYKQHAKRRAAQAPPAMRPSGGQGYGTPMPAAIAEARAQQMPQQQQQPMGSQMLYPQQQATPQQMPAMPQGEADIYGGMTANGGRNVRVIEGANEHMEHFDAQGNPVNPQQMTLQGLMQGMSPEKQQEGAQVFQLGGPKSFLSWHHQQQQMAAKTGAAGAAKTPDFNHATEQPQQLLKVAQANLAQYQKRMSNPMAQPLSPAEQADMNHWTQVAHSATQTLENPHAVDEFQAAQRNAAGDADITRALGRIHQPVQAGPNQAPARDQEMHALYQQGFDPHRVAQIPRPPQGQHWTLQPDVAKMYLKAAGGDMHKAAALAEAHGYVESNMMPPK